MVNIIKRGISEELNEKILNNILEKVKNIKSLKELNSFLSELLTSDEQIMIKKRLAISVLLKEGKRKKHISELLDVSRTTINSVKKENKTKSS